MTNCTITTGSMQNIANGLVETFDNTAETFRSECSVLPSDTSCASLTFACPASVLVAPVSCAGLH